MNNHSMLNEEKEIKSCEKSKTSSQKSPQKESLGEKIVDVILAIAALVALYFVFNWVRDYFRNDETPESPIHDVGRVDWSKVDLGKYKPMGGVQDRTFTLPASTSTTLTPDREEAIKKQHEEALKEYRNGKENNQ